MSDQAILVVLRKEESPLLERLSISIRGFALLTEGQDTPGCLSR